MKVQKVAKISFILHGYANKYLLKEASIGEAAVWVVKSLTLLECEFAPRVRLNLLIMIY